LPYLTQFLQTTYEAIMFINMEGKQVPQCGFKIIENNQLTERSSDCVFKDKTVIVFALPGAYTPTCSSSHLPRYNELAKQFFDSGVDEILCLSVNDPFVMKAWASEQQAEHISVLPDGNGEFSEQMGMLVDKASLGFGKRSWRYSMLVKNGVIEKMFIEPDVEGDPFEVSDADTMLAYVNPQAVQTSNIAIITKPDCPFCLRAKTLLKEKGLTFDEITLEKEMPTSTFKALTNATTVPQVFIDGKLVGGSDDLAAHFSN